MAIILTWKVQKVHVYEIKPTEHQKWVYHITRFIEIII